MSDTIQSAKLTLTEVKKAYIATINTYIDDIKKMYDADGVKVYYQDSTHYAFKIIKDDRVIAIFRSKRNSFDNK